MKKISSLLLAFIVLVALVTGCASSKNASYSSAAPSAPQSMNDMAAEFAPAPRPEEGKSVVSGSGGNAPVLSERKIVKNARMEMETKEFDADLQKIIDAITAAGGYIESQSVNGNSIYRGYSNSKNAVLSARIPAEKLDATGAALSEICNVVRQSSGSDDITDVYYDSDARLKSLSLQEERLLEILSKAEKLEDVITLEQALSNVRYQIESLTAQLRRMDNQVSYSYLNIELSEVVEYQHKEKTFMQRLSASFSRSANNIKGTLESMLFTVIEDGPVIAINLVIWGVVLFGVYKTARKLGWNPSIRMPSRKAKNAQSEQNKQQDKE